MDGLPQNFDDLLSFLKIRATQQINDDFIASEYALRKCLRLLLDVENDDGGAWNWDCFLIFLNECSHKLVGFLALMDHEMIVTHLFKEAMADETVDAGDEDALTAIHFLHVVCIVEMLLIET